MWKARLKIMLGFIGGLGGPELAVLFLGFVLLMLAPLFAVIHCARNRRLSDANRIIGIIVILLVPVVGIIIYLVLPREDNHPQ